MKKIYYTLLFIFTCSAVIAQKGNVKKADYLFNQRAYFEAASIYENCEPTKDVLQNLGDCYYFNSQMVEAANTYKELYADHKDVDKEYLFRYSQALKGMKNYRKADGVLKQYAGESINTLDYINTLKKVIPYKYELKRLSDVQNYNDFGATFYGNKLVFATDRNEQRKIYSWNNRPYLDLYIADVTKNGELGFLEQFDKEINTDNHESNATFTKDLKTIYFNRTNNKKKKFNGQKVANVKIYKAEFIDGKWRNEKALSFCSDEYSTQHPSISRDGTKLYFSSDMPGSLGSFDIYVVDVNADGTYGKPQNLGPNVNTTHLDQFPFISEQNILYFSSNDHIGLGGLDIFMTEMESSGEFTPAVNLGNSINSNSDDFGYTMKSGSDIGLFSSNREGNDNLYTFLRKENYIPVVAGPVKDKNSGELLPQAGVALLDAKGEKLKDTVVGDDARFSFDVEPNKEYALKVTKDKYIPSEIKFKTNDQGKLNKDVKAKLESYADAEENIKKKKEELVQVDLEPIYFNFNETGIRPDAGNVLNGLVTLMKKYPVMEVEISAHTDVRGDASYNLELSKQRAASTLEYLVKNGIDRKRLRSIGYGETKPMNKCVREGICTDEEYNLNRRCEFTVLK